MMTTERLRIELYRAKGRGAGPAAYAVHRPLQAAKVAWLGLPWVAVSAS